MSKTFCGYSGEFSDVKTLDKGIIKQQRFVSEWRNFPSVSPSAKIRFEARFDDHCGNGKESFAITGEVVDPKIRGNDKTVMCGCIHKEIAKAFPKIAHLTKWHLFDYSGPMHYVENTVYLAGDRDHWGKRKGEAYAYQQGVRFGNNPIFHPLTDKFAAFLQDNETGLNGRKFDFEVIQIWDDKRGEENKKRNSGFTYGGFADKWFTCPFKTEREALEFLQALQTCEPKFSAIPSLYSEGKTRELDSARSVAVWPDATDEELSQEPEQLKAALRARLPGLIEQFKSDIIATGFAWPNRA